METQEIKQPTPQNTTFGGNPVSEQQLREIEKDGSKKLKETSPGQYTVLERMRG